MSRNHLWAEKVKEFEQVIKINNNLIADWDQKYGLSDDEYGLLNTAKFAIYAWNSNRTIIANDTSTDTLDNNNDNINATTAILESNYRDGHITENMRIVPELEILTAKDFKSPFLDIEIASITVLQHMYMQLL